MILERAWDTQFWLVGMKENPIEKGFSWLKERNNKEKLVFLPLSMAGWQNHSQIYWGKYVTHQCQHAEYEHKDTEFLMLPLDYLIN